VPLTGGVPPRPGCCPTGTDSLSTSVQALYDIHSLNQSTHHFD